MSEILVIRRHGLSRADAKQAAEAIAQALADEHALAYEWVDELVLHFMRSGVNGSLLLDEGQVTVRVRLGWLLIPFKSALEDAIHDYFDQHFSEH
ncbi:poly(3-hydroxybutyrate) depolymerase [Aquitalea sp. S1-19]|nr:poly(3-hydroxybutyrate) depolymerase [Aquitalea sp. S1-19]